MGISHSWNGTILTITSDSGTSSADLKGDMGIRGPQGPAGVVIGGDGGEVNVDLTNYYTKEETDNAISVAIEEIPEVDLSNYATKTYVTEEVAKAATSGQVDLSSYATKTYVTEQIEAIDFPETDLSNYYTKAQTNSAISTAIGNIDFPETDLSNYYTKSQTDSKINSAKPDLTPYAKKTDIPSLSGYATETYVNNAIANIESEDISIPAFWDSAVNTAIARIKELQQGKNCVTFAHFSDNHNRQGYSGKLIKKVMEECNIPYCFYNGDSIDSGYIANETTMINQEKAFAKMLSIIPEEKLCRSLGNHDGFWKVNANEQHSYTRNQNYELFMRKLALSQNKEFGNDGTYYYVEDLASKIRFIVLNSNGGSIDTEQLEWLQNKALNFDSTGWGIVFFSHAPITNNFHSNISNAQEVQIIIKNFIEAETAEVIGWYSGHIHRDRIYKCDATGNTGADDITTDNLPWKTITITSDHTGISYENATTHTVAEDNLSHAIDFVTVNRDTKEVNLTRLGIGNNRVYSYNNVILYSITNKLTNVSTNSSINNIEKGNSYTANLTVNSGYENLTVKITMGGSDITATVYSNGAINIASVTGDIVITASAEEIQAETLPITWKNGYTCTHAVGSACTETASANYAISENIPVIEGETYLLSRSDGQKLTATSKFNIVELNANNVVVKSIEIKHDGFGSNTTYTYTPSSGVTQMIFRGYSAAYEEYQKFILTKQ